MEGGGASAGAEGGRPVLITGGAGFLGVHLARLLADAGRDVCLLDVSEPMPQRRFALGDHAERLIGTLVVASVDDWSGVVEAVRDVRPAAIVHAAAIVDPVRLARQPGVALRTNVGGSVNVLEAARLFGVERVVLVSSIGVLPSVRYEPIDAAHPVLLPSEGPGSGFYGAAKVASEAFALAYEQCLDLDVRIVRPSAVYGLGMGWPIYVRPMVEAALRGERVTFDSGGPLRRDYTHVRDVASLTAAVIDAPAGADRIFFAATGEPLVSAAQAAAIVRELVPGAQIEIGDRLSDDDRLESRYRGRISIANAVEQLGWRPRFSSLRDGLAEYVEALRAFLASG